MIEKSISQKITVLTTNIRTGTRIPADDRRDTGDISFERSMIRLSTGYAVSTWLFNVNGIQSKI